MRMTLSSRAVTVVAVTAIAAGAQALIPRDGAAPAGRPPGVTIAQAAAGAAAQAAAVRYWTPAKLAAALRAADGQAAAVKPAPHPRVRQLVRKAPAGRRRPSLTGSTSGQGISWNRGGAVAAAVGKVFFTLGDQDYVCSGALVGGKHPDVVLTAAHCVTSGAAPAGHRSPVTRPDGAAQWATNWIFVPGFRDGRMPYGEYTARRFFAVPGWTGPDGGGEQDDVAFVRVTRYGAAGPAKPPPGLPLGFAPRQDALPSGPAYVLGYPAQAPYDGQYLEYCAGPAARSGGSLRTTCAMTAGDSGGPWLAGFSPRAGGGRVVAVSTYKLSSDLRVLYGAVLGPRARALYEQAQHQRAVSPAR